MGNAKYITEESRSWIFVAPVKRLILTKAVRHEIKVDQIAFVSSEKAPRIRKRLGFPETISYLRTLHSGVLKQMFSEGKTFAVQRLTGHGNEKSKEFLCNVREELALLSLSQLGYGRRRNNAFPVLSDEYPIGRRSFLMLDTAKRSWVQPNNLVGRFADLVLDELWLNFQKESFFFDLLKILRGEVRVSQSWRRDIRNAAILAGQSQNSLDIAHAFLWNIIAIELLLTKRGDSYSDSLPERAEAFIGWTSDWKDQDYKERIRELYKKRCKLVHAGDRELVEIKDVLISDVILLNVLTNIVKHPKLFNSKDDVVRFSNKVSAEHLLGVRSKTRPKTFSFISPLYREKDFQEF